MHKLFGMTAAIMASFLMCPQGFAFTQSDCNQLKKLQTDGSGRQVIAKLDANAHGNCVPKPPIEKEQTPSQKQPPEQIRGQ